MTYSTLDVSGDPKAEFFDASRSRCSRSRASVRGDEQKFDLLPVVLGRCPHSPHHSSQDEEDKAHQKQNTSAPSSRLLSLSFFSFLGLAKLWQWGMDLKISTTSGYLVSFPLSGLSPTSPPHPRPD